MLLKHGMHDGVAKVTIANPPYNMLTVDMIEEMANHVAASVRERVLVLAAEGDAFSAGVETVDGSAVDTIAAFRRLFDELTRFDGITIAVVDGAALGGGCELACACDVIVASNRAEFGQAHGDMRVLPPLLWPRLLSGADETPVDAERLRLSGMNVRACRTGTLAATVSGAIDEYMNASALAVAYAKRARQRGARSHVDASLRQVQALYLSSRKSMTRARRVAVGRHGAAADAPKRKSKPSSTD